MIALWMPAVATPEPTPAELWTFLSSVLFLASVFAGYWVYRANRRKAEEPHDPQRRILPQPLETRNEDPPLRTSVFREQVARRNFQVNEIEQRVEKKLVDHQSYVRDKFHKVAADLQAIQSHGDNRGEQLSGQLVDLSKKLHGVCEEVAGIRVKTDRIENIETKLDRVIERQISNNRGGR